MPHPQLVCGLHLRAVAPSRSRHPPAAGTAPGPHRARIRAGARQPPPGAEPRTESGHEGTAATAAMLSVNGVSLLLLPRPRLEHAAARTPSPAPGPSDRSRSRPRRPRSHPDRPHRAPPAAPYTPPSSRPCGLSSRFPGPGGPYLASHLLAVQQRQEKAVLQGCGMASVLQESPQGGASPYWLLCPRVQR